MEKPFTADNTPLSLTVGRFDFVPAPDGEIGKLQEEIRALKSRVAALEKEQSQMPWWKHFFRSAQNP